MAARSLLFVPGDQSAMLERAAGRGADALIVDLEDAVAPSQRVRAREVVAEWLTGPVGGECWVRVGPEMATDLAQVGAHLRDGVVLPKATSAGEVEAATSLLLEQAPAAGAIVLIETAGALEEVGAIARIPGVRRLMIGELDLGADLGIDPDLPAWDAIRLDVVVASAAARLPPPIAGVDRDFGDVERLERESQRLASMGFGGRAAIHPAQVEPINRAFTPSPEAIAAAREALARHEAAVSQGVGAYTDPQGRMVDEAVLRRARSILDAARRAGLDPWE